MEAPQLALQENPPHQLPVVPVAAHKGKQLASYDHPKVIISKQHEDFFISQSCRLNCLELLAMYNSGSLTRGINISQ